MHHPKDCSSCHSKDISLVERESLAIGDHYARFIAHYQCNRCGATWSIPSDK